MSIYSKLSDLELMALLKNGDHTAFDTIYKKYSKMLLDTAFKRLDAIEEAEELVQELFINLYIRRDEVEISSSLEAFLKTSLKYRVFNVYRTRFSRERYAALMEKENKLDYADPQRHLEVKQLSEQIQRSTQKLPKKCREVFILSKVENLSNKSIAEKLGISVSAVEQHITKAMKLMKADFGAYDPGTLLVLILIFCK